MKNIKDLGKLVKRQNPGDYDDLTDEQVGRLVKKKHPEDYYDYFDEGTIAKVTELQDYYSPTMGRLRSWWRRGKSESRAKLISALGVEQAEVLRQGALLADAVMEGKRKQVEWEEFLARHQATLFQMRVTLELIGQALEQGYTLENWQQVKISREALGQRKEEKSLDSHLRKDELEHGAGLNRKQMKLEGKLRRIELELEHRLALELETHMAQLRLEEFQEMEAIRYQNETLMMQEKLRLAMISKTLGDQQRALLVQERLDAVYREIEEIRTDPKLLPETKVRMITDREELIEMFKRYRNDSGDRLLQNGNGGDV